MQTIKTGYKQTNIGIIPEDWEVKRLGEIFDFKNGLNKEKQYFGYGTPIVNYVDVYKKRGLQSSEIIGKVDVNKQELKAYEVQKGDVFFTRTSETVDEIGLSSVILDDVKQTVFSGFVLRGRPKTLDLETAYKKYCFSSNQVRIEITSKSSYTTRALTNGKLLASVQIPVPPLDEQKRIAQALSDMDGLITNLEELIAKKQSLKQGAMQELLKPKEGWEVKGLGEIAIVNMGQSPLSEYYNKQKIGLPLIQGNADIKDRKTIIRSYTSVITRKGKEGDVIMSVRAPVGEVAKATFDCCLGRGVCAISYKNEYIYHYLMFIEKSWSNISTGSTFDSVTSKQVKELGIHIPISEVEQKRIANILSEIDEELAVLENKRTKYQQFKTGMMQELLTGKIRLK